MITLAQLTPPVQSADPKLSDGDLFLYGAIGAVVALFVVQVLPFMFEALRRPTAPDVAWWKVPVALIIVGIFLAGGGVAALIAGDATNKGQAIAYGLAWQASIGGAIQGVRAGGT